LKTGLELDGEIFLEEIRGKKIKSVKGGKGREPSKKKEAISFF